MKVIVLRGIPGSGKSTETSKYPDAYTVSADHYFIGKDGVYRFDMNKIASAHGQCKAKFEAALKAKKPLVIVDNTNTTVKELKFYVETAKTFGYEIEIVRIECDPKVAAKRNVHGVPEASILKMAERLTSSKLPADYPTERVIKTS
jgi:predicted kinase